MKRGDLSINIIIVAAIALLILVIISVLLFRSGGSLRQGTEDCSAIQGICDSDITCGQVAYDYPDTTWVPNPTRKCPQVEDTCCTRI